MKTVKDTVEFPNKVADYCCLWLIDLGFSYKRGSKETPKGIAHFVTVPDKETRFEFWPK